MPTKLTSLKKQAKESCTFRKHKMGNFYQLYRSETYRSDCKCCYMSVFVIPKPLPNEIDIGGEAVAVTCSSYRQNFKPVIR